MEERILNYLKRHHIGQLNAVSSSYLESRFKIKGATLRKYINTLRSDGHPICSDERGYFYAATREEVRDTVRQLRSRIGKIITAVIGLVISQAKLPDDSGQISLPM